MIVYFSVLIISTALALLSSKLTKTYSLKIANSGKIVTIKQSNIFSFFSFVPLFLVSGLRYQVGVDYNSYAWIFNAINTLKEKTHVEIGYEMLNKIVGFYTDNYIYIFMVAAGITLTFFYFAIKNQSDNFAFSVFLFISLGYFFYSMNSVRHFMALSIYLYSVRYMKEGKFFKFLILILFAATFHKIALIAIPIYFVFRLKLKISYYGIIAVFLMIMAVFSKQIMAIVFKFIYTSYQGSVYNVYTFSVFNVLLCAIATVLALLYYKQLLQKDEGNIVYINAAVFMLMFYVFCGFIPTPTRIGHFGTILFIFLIPKAISCEKNKKVRIFYYACIIIFALLFLIMMLIKAQDATMQLLPYQTVFSR